VSGSDAGTRILGVLQAAVSIPARTPGARTAGRAGPDAESERRGRGARALTSAVHLAQVGEAPHVAQAHGVGDAGEHELQRVAPLRPRFLHGPHPASERPGCVCGAFPPGSACGWPRPPPIARLLIANLINGAPVGGARLVNG
jgi:hypothetical protein